MDPVSITASAVSIASFCGKLVAQIGIFVYAVHEEQDTLAGFYSNIRHLQYALDTVAKVLRQSPSLPLSESENFEREHYGSVGDILKSCEATLRSLESRLPELAEPGTTLRWIQRARDTLAMRLKDEVIKSLWAQVNSFAQVLDLSISTLSLASNWRMAHSQAEIQNQIRQLTDEMRSCNLASEWDDAEACAEDSLPADIRRQIRHWRASADDVAVAVSLRRPGPRRKRPAATAASLIAQTPASKPPSLPTITETPDLPAFERVEPLGHDVLGYILNANQTIVTQLVECGLFVKAAQYQEKGMRFRETLARVHGLPFPYQQRADMKERLVQILMACKLPQATMRARYMLKEMVDEEETDGNGGNPEGEVGRELQSGSQSGSQLGSRPGSETDTIGVDEVKTTEMACRYYHYLGRVDVELGHMHEAKAYLEQAFGGRRLLSPMPAELVRESARLLIEVCMQLGAIDEADGLTSWMRDRLDGGNGNGSNGGNINDNGNSNCNDSGGEGQVATVALPGGTTGGRPEANFARGCEWCKDLGFNVDRYEFHFDIYDEKLRTTPVHAAISRRDAEMLQLMLGCLQSLAGLETLSYTATITSSTTLAASAASAATDTAAATLATSTTTTTTTTTTTPALGSRLVHPVLLAAATRNEALLEPLLAAGVSADYTDENGCTALHACQSKEGGVGCARLVVGACGKNMVDEMDNSGKTALFMAVEMGNEDMVGFLLGEAGADANIAHSAPGSGMAIQSPLAAAIEAVCEGRTGRRDNIKRMVKIVGLLLHHGAEPYAKGMNGCNAVDWAKQAGLARDMILKMIQTSVARRESNSGSSLTGTTTTTTTTFDIGLVGGKLNGRRESDALTGDTMVRRPMEASSIGAESRRESQQSSRRSLRYSPTMPPPTTSGMATATAAGEGSNEAKVSWWKKVTWRGKG